MDIKKEIEKRTMDLKKEIEKRIDVKEIEATLQRNLEWLEAHYPPAKFLTLVGVIVIVVGMIGTGIAIAKLIGLFTSFELWTLVTKKRFFLMVGILGCGLFLWIFLTGVGIVTRRRWAGVSCIIAFVLVQSQSVYVGESFLSDTDYRATAFLMSVILSIAAYGAIFVIQFYWEVLMQDRFTLSKDITREKLLQRSQSLNYWGFHTHDRQTGEKIFFVDNVISTAILLFFSLGWAVWWYWQELVVYFQ